ncbi:MAG: hypothetical protein WCJ30_02120 [Deltaproteobacteria bacterium]
MARNLALALVFIAAVIGAIVLVAYRTNDGAPGEHARDAPSARYPLVGRDGGVTGRAAQAMLEQIARQSRGLMPEGYAGLYLSMPLDELRRLRPRIQRDGRPRPDAIEVWEEDDPNGAHVIYLVSPVASLLEQVQFASRLDDARQFPAHLQAVTARYGTPTGIWDCPQTEEASPVRRFTWRHEGASVMEATLIAGDRVAVTLVVASNEDIGNALTRSRCESVRTVEQLERLPVASEIRGERREFVREIVRDR